MTLRLHDTATRGVRDFIPLEAGKASIYLCGLTVQGPPHIGHLRSSVAFDVLRRWLQHRDFEVTFIRNVTDIDDKIIHKSAEHGVPWWAWAASNERAVASAYERLNCIPPSFEPRATGHMTEMITLMRRLIDRGHAYANDGDVFFSVRSLPSYGDLSGQNVDEMQQGEDVVAENRKRDPRDFALWKAAKPGEPSWPTPWGDGRPGWHLECSAMATKYLGSSFDIHGGGRDLVFPHHENERAQSNAAGDGFAQYWLHNGWVTMAGEKMSKSLGNSLLVSEVIKHVRPMDLRYYLLSAHYRADMEFSDDSLRRATLNYNRIEEFLQRSIALVSLSRMIELTRPIVGQLPNGFAEYMDDDVNISAALGTVFEQVRVGNKAIDNQNPLGAAEAAERVITAMQVLGLDPVVRRSQDRAYLELRDAEDDGRPARALEALLSNLQQGRKEARQRGDWQVADFLRNAIVHSGIEFKDTKTDRGFEWRLR